MNAWTDLRHGIRLVAKNPAFAAAAVGVLALGIAANMVVFTLVNGILLRDLPFDEPDRIVQLGGLQPRQRPQPDLEFLVPRHARLERR